MRKMLEELRKNLGMPPERDADNQDYGYRSTLRVRDLEAREIRDHEDLSGAIDVPVQRSASRPQSAGRPSPPLPSNPRPGSGVGRPPLPRPGRSRGDSRGTGSQDSVDPLDSSPKRITDPDPVDFSPQQVGDPPDFSLQRINVLTIDSQFENTNYSSYSEARENGLLESDDGYDETDGGTTRGPVSPASARSAGDQPGSLSSARSRRREYRRDTNSVSTAVSTEQPYRDPGQSSPLDMRDGILNPPSADDSNQLGGTRTIEVMQDVENGAPGTVSHGG